MEQEEVEEEEEEEEEKEIQHVRRVLVLNNQDEDVESACAQ